MRGSRSAEKVKRERCVEMKPCTCGVDAPLVRGVSVSRIGTGIGAFFEDFGAGVVYISACHGDGSML